ncbi:translation initiation factor eIF-3 subunit 2 [Exophiala viscosa]|uniref:translation initiation factor eIF-3 subunit 2 n=1 Tax=Exophiala viscosa TaxID=2486360 RepID=UPI00218D81F6|nr:translation initiation factor eIF-3 subunit 2 [Exophiala viscosa]
MSETPRIVPLTCHGHSRPITHLSFSSVVDDDQYYLISASKDNNPMLRDGITGDWIGTFIGHKGAVWSSRLSSDAKIAATGSADFTARIWDPQTGECLHILEHKHIVRAVAFPVQDNPQCVATGGQDKRLKIFDLTRGGSAAPQAQSTSSPTTPSATGEGLEIGADVHGGTIKSIVWNVDYNILTTACEDKTIRWWDLRSQRMITSVKTERDIGSCELSTNKSGDTDPGIISVAAGHSCLFFAAGRPGQLIKQINFDHDIASAAVNTSSGRFVTGGGKDTWVRVWDFEQEKELEVLKGHHGPIWTAAFSPDGKLYATGSEDGTIKLWKACKEPYGLWR